MIKYSNQVLTCTCAFRVTRSSNFVSKNLAKVVHGSLNNPECLTVIPLLELLCHDEFASNTPRPNLPLYAKWEDLVKKFRKKEYEK